MMGSVAMKVLVKRPGREDHDFTEHEFLDYALALSYAFCCMRAGFDPVKPLQLH
jgi:hypothetical protein